ncbi:MAG: hypothetical protein V1918_10215 [Planctomycetota bacterium]
MSSLQTAPVSGRICQSCGKVYPSSAFICTDCGINLKTGIRLGQKTGGKKTMTKSTKIAIGIGAIVLLIALAVLKMIFLPGDIEVRKVESAYPEKAFQSFQAAAAKKDAATIFNFNTPESKMALLNILSKEILGDAASKNKLDISRPEDRKKLDKIHQDAVGFAPGALDKVLDADTARKNFQAVIQVPAGQKAWGAMLSAVAGAQYGGDNTEDIWGGRTAFFTLVMDGKRLSAMLRMGPDGWLLGPESWRTLGFGEGLDRAIVGIDMAVVFPYATAIQGDWVIQRTIKNGKVLGVALWTVRNIKMEEVLADPSKGERGGKYTELGSIEYDVQELDAAGKTKSSSQTFPSYRSVLTDLKERMTQGKSTFSKTGQTKVRTGGEEGSYTYFCTYFEFKNPDETLSRVYYYPRFPTGRPVQEASHFQTPDKIPQLVETLISGTAETQTKKTLQDWMKLPVDYVSKLKAAPVGP